MSLDTTGAELGACHICENGISISSRLVYCSLLKTVVDGYDNCCAYVQKQASNKKKAGGEQKMTIKEQSTMKRLLGILEGMGHALPKEMQEVFQATVEELNDHIDQNGVHQTDEAWEERR